MKNAKKPATSKPLESGRYYALVKKVAPGSYNICFRLSNSAQDVWRAVIGEEFLGSGQTRESLRKAGWRAKRVGIVI